jgi:hypothetical protein
MDTPRVMEWKAENPDLILPSVDPDPPDPVGVYCPMDQAQSVPSIPLGYVYTLTPKETEICVKIGKERNAKNLEKRTKNMNYSQRDDTQISIQGVVGEWAMCKMFGLPIEIYDTTCRNTFTEKRFDAVFPNGWTCDVKTTLYEVELRVTVWKINNPPNLYALLVIKNYTKDMEYDPSLPPEVCFRGFVTSKELFRPEHLKMVRNYGRPMNYYCMSQNSLKTFEQICDQERKGELSNGSSSS